MKSLKRREFLISGTLACVGLLALAGCNSGTSASADNTGQGGNQNCGDGGQTQYTNPGHAHSVVTLTATQLSQAIDGDYQLMGGSHPHFFSLTGPDFASLASGQTVLKSDLEGHGHIIAISC